MLTQLSGLMLAPLINRLHLRAQWWPLGVFPLASQFTLSNLTVSGTDIALKFPVGEFARQQWECKHLFIDDPYELRKLPPGLRTVLDIGGNIGFFSLLARHYFKSANIDCYEPNPKLAPILTSNIKGLNIRFYPQGVGKTDCTANFADSDCTLEGAILPSESGSIQICSLASAIERMGGDVDLLKMDCEGGEWDILSDKGSMAKIRHLAMEYHITESCGETVCSLIAQLKDLGFRLDSFRESSASGVGQLTATNLRLV